MLANRIHDLTGALVNEAPSRHSAGVLRFRSRGSLQVWISGEKQGKWRDYESGDYGDALALVAHLRRTDIKEAYRWSIDWLGIGRRGYVDAALIEPVQRPPGRSVAQLHQPRPNNTGLAQQLWNEAVDARGTLVETYFANRGLVLPPDAPIRFHPTCPRGAERLPAMLSLMTDPLTAEPCGVHRTFLAADGSGKAQGQAKMMLGHAGVIRLVPDEYVELGLGLAEGVETSLAVMQGFGWRPVWAATSAGSIMGFPVLPGLDAITVFADADDGGVGLKAATACVKRWVDAGRDARIIAAPPDFDFADLIMRVG